LRVHRTTRLELDEVMFTGAVPITTPARTVLDLAADTPVKEFRRAFENALVSRRVRIDQIRSLLYRSPGRPGTAAARALLGQHDQPALTRSEAERRLLDLMRGAGLAPAYVNARIGRYEVDMLWLPQRLVVEVDGYAYHANRAAFERDRLRDAALQAAGYRVIRVTWRQLRDRPEAVVARLAQALIR
jgi:very-short-patch-repair endonuclease